MAKPSTEEYWHMGEMTMRCLRVMDRRVYGVKRRLMLLFGHYNGRVRYIVQRGDAIAGRASEKGDRSKPVSFPRAISLRILPVRLLNLNP